MNWLKPLSNVRIASASNPSAMDRFACSPPVGTPVALGLGLIPPWLRTPVRCCTSSRRCGLRSRSRPVAQRHLPGSRPTGSPARTASAVTVPLQAGVNPFGVDTEKPSESAVVEALSASDVNRRSVGEWNGDVVLSSGIVPSPKALVIAGGTGGETVSVAFDVLPVPPFEEFTWTLLFFTPAVVPLTLPSCTKAHRPLLRRLGQARRSGARDSRGDYRHWCRPFGVAAAVCRLASVKATPSRDANAFWIVDGEVQRRGADTGSITAARNFVIVGGSGGETVSAAFDVLPMPPLVEFTWTLLFFTPRVVPCTPASSCTRRRLPGLRRYFASRARRQQSRCRRR